jgi:hypothetical protein
VDVAPHEFLKDLRRRRAFEQRQRLSGDALAGKPRGRRVVALADAAAAAIAAAAVAAEEQLVLMALQNSLF